MPREQIETPESLKTSEQIDPQPKYVLVTGASRGTGLVIAHSLVDQGFNVYLGASTQENADTAHQQHFDSNPRVIPLGLNMLDKDKIVDTLDRLAEHRDKFPPVIVHAAAAGMERFDKKLALDLARLQRLKNKGNVFVEGLKGFNQKCSDLVHNPENWQYTQQVNFHGPDLFLNEYIKRCPDKITPRLVYLTSLWCTLRYFGAPIMALYEGISDSKRKFEGSLHVVGNHPENGIDVDVISGGAIADTDVGRVFKTFILPLAYPEEIALIESTFITKADMSKITMQALLEDPAKRFRNPQTWYVFGPNAQSYKFVNLETPAMKTVLSVQDLLNPNRY